MNLENLWGDLKPKKSTLDQLKKDYETGLTPNLPYFIIGQDNAKETIGNKLKQIDEHYFNRSLIYSDYGNGKTNLLKYLKLYFEQNNNENIHYIYQRANIDRPDIFLNILKLIEDELEFVLIKSLRNINSSFIEKQSSEHSNISKYISKFKEISLDDDFKELIYMGTGRFYTKNYYNLWKIPQLTDFDRREVFIFFMNVLSHNNQYVIFSLDEIEKIYEKSKMRFRSFLTSYRELIDMSSQINGHYLLTAIVSSAANIDDILLENPAFYSRIKSDMVPIDFLKLDNEKKELINKISNLLDTELIPSKIDVIANSLKREYGRGIARSNRLLLADIYRLIKKELDIKSYKQLEIKLQELEIEDEFEDMYQELDDEEIFSKIQNRFFDPLQYYLEYKGYEINTKKGSNFFKKTNLFYPYKAEKVYSFILNHNAIVEEEIIKLKNLVNDNKEVVVFTPESIDITYEDFSENENIIIINYEPTKLFTLLEMFEAIELQNEVKEAIYEYTKGQL